MHLQCIDNVLIMVSRYSVFARFYVRRQMWQFPSLKLVEAVIAESGILYPNPFTNGVSQFHKHTGLLHLLFG